MQQYTVGIVFESKGIQINKIQRNKINPFESSFHNSTFSIYLFINLPALVFKPKTKANHSAN